MNLEIDKEAIIMTRYRTEEDLLKEEKDFFNFIDKVKNEFSLYQKIKKQYEKAESFLKNHPKKRKKS